MSQKRLTEGFRAVIEMRWTEFIEFEGNINATNFDSIIAALVRACRKGSLRAIQTGLDRLDGKIATEIEVEYPKFYTLYPYATKTADDPSIIDLPAEIEQKSSSFTPPPAPVKPPKATADEELPTGSLRLVLERMIDAPKAITAAILEATDLIEAGEPSRMNPQVKSVIVAGLMKLVHDGKMSAVFEVFDQLDGKVSDKIKVLGGDVYFKRFETIAPAGAVKNEDGIYQIASEDTTNVWTARLEANRKGR